MRIKGMYFSGYTEVQLQYVYSYVSFSFNGSVFIVACHSHGSRQRKCCIWIKLTLAEI